MRPRLVFVDDLPSSQPYMHILQGHQDYWHSTEKTVGASPVTTSNLLLQKAVPLLLKLRTCRILHAVLLLVLVVHPWPISCSTLNCTIDEVPGVSGKSKHARKAAADECTKIYDGLPACRAGSCREKYKEKKPYWCDSIRLCVSGPNACNDTDEFPGVPPRSPPPPADPYFDPKYCSGAHIRGFDRKTNSCLCEEGWYTTPNPYYCDSPILDPPSVFFFYIFPDEDSTSLVIMIFILAGILAMCILLCYISTVKTVVRFANLGGSRWSNNNKTVTAEMIRHSNQDEHINSDSVLIASYSCSGLATEFTSRVP